MKLRKNKTPIVISVGKKNFLTWNIENPVLRWVFNKLYTLQLRSDSKEQKQ